MQTTPHTSKTFQVPGALFAVIGISLGLTGCVNLLSAPKPAITAVAKPAPAAAAKMPEAQQVATAAAAAPADTAASAYVDPMIVSADGSLQRRSRAYRPPETPPSESAMQQPQAAQQPSSDFAALVNQPTAVRAGASSLYAMSSPSTTAPGMPATDAPAPMPVVGRINPMAGSVFSAQASPATPSSGGAKNGLW